MSSSIVCVACEIFPFEEAAHTQTMRTRNGIKTKSSLRPLGSRLLNLHYNANASHIVRTNVMQLLSVWGNSFVHKRFATGAGLRLTRTRISLLANCQLSITKFQLKFDGMYAFVCSENRTLQNLQHFQLPTEFIGIVCLIITF